MTKLTVSPELVANALSTGPAANGMAPCRAAARATSSQPAPSCHGPRLAILRGHAERAEGVQDPERIRRRAPRLRRQAGSMAMSPSRTMAATRAAVLRDGGDPVFGLLRAHAASESPDANHGR